MAPNREAREMTSIPRAATAAVTLLFAMAAVPASAQKQGGVLRMYNPDSPASMSILEEATVFAEGPMMGVFNNLVMYDQRVKQQPSIGRARSGDGLVMERGRDRADLPVAPRRQISCGKSVTARDVKCTWDLLTGNATDKLRINPRQSWYRNLEQVTTNGDYEVTFHLKRLALRVGFSAKLSAPSESKVCSLGRLTASL
jgi:peptide/nickel transport system substrate-binding protein